MQYILSFLVRRDGNIFFNDWIPITLSKPKHSLIAVKLEILSFHWISNCFGSGLNIIDCVELADAFLMNNKQSGSYNNAF